MRKLRNMNRENRTRVLDFTSTLLIITEAKCHITK